MRLPAVFALAVAAASLLAPAGDGRSTSTLVFQVKSVLVSHTLRDLVPKGLSSGDVVVEHDALYNVVFRFHRPAGALVGIDQATLTFRSKTRVAVGGTARLPDGTITFNGVATIGSTALITVPVTAGTGRYKHARGTVTVGGPATNVNTYRLTLP
jgi:hypothetical protein